MSDGTATQNPSMEDWAGEMGERWLANLAKFEEMIAPAGAALMAHAGFGAGERVVDVGCGGGATTIEIGRAVAPGGTVLGIDISPVLIDAARRRADAAGLANVRFMTADAATVRPDGAPFDRLLSRFGSMFFTDFAAAFANYRALLRDGGRADLAVWAPVRENGWIAGVQAIIGSHLESAAAPAAPPPAHAPGPFALDDPAFVRPLLEEAGFEAQFTLWRGDQLIGGAGAKPAEAAAFVLEAMPFADALHERPAELDAVRGELTDLFARHHGGDGIRMSGAAWLITAYAR